VAALVRAAGAWPVAGRRSAGIWPACPAPIYPLLRFRRRWLRSRGRRGFPVPERGVLADPFRHRV